MKYAEAGCPEEESVSWEESADDAEDDFGIAEVSYFFVEIGAGGDECESVEYEASGCDEFVVAEYYLSDDDDAAGGQGDDEVDDDAVCGGGPEGGSLFFSFTSGEDEAGGDGCGEYEYGDEGELPEELRGFSDDVVVGARGIVWYSEFDGEPEGHDGAAEGVYAGEDSGESAEGKEF